MGKKADAPVIHIGNIRCKIEHISSGLANVIDKAFAIPVPNYWFSTRYKNHTWDGRNHFYLRQSNTVPTGLLPLVLEHFEDNEVEYTIDDQREHLSDYKMEEVADDYSVTEEKESREYQVQTINKVITNEVVGQPFIRGVINIATNGGKTTIAEAIMGQVYPMLKKNHKYLLFVTHSKEIAYQSKKSIENDLGIDVGILGDGKWELKTISVALIPTLYKRIKKPEFKNLVEDVVGFIGDEIHHSTSNSWYEVLNKFKNATIRLGLTGTVDKQNKANEYKLYSTTGPIINRISNDYLIKHGYSAKPICIMFKVQNPELEGELYQDAYQLGIVESEERNGIIKDICGKETEQGNSVLILVEHIDHGEFIKEDLEKINKNVIFTNGQLDSEERQNILDGLRDGTIDVLISTSILDEGVDVSNINAVIYARGMKSPRKLLQGIGRGLRKKKDNSKLRFYDFIDDTHSSLLAHSLNRYEVLEAEAFDIKVFEVEEYLQQNLEEL